MDGQILIGGVDVGLVPAGLGDTRLQIVGDQHGTGAAEVAEHPYMGAGPVGQALAEVGLGVGVARCPQDADEDGGVTQFAGVGVDDRHGGAGVVDEAFLTGFVGLSQRGLEVFLPTAEPLAKPAVAVAVGVGLAVLLPQEQQGHPRAAQLCAHLDPVGQGDLAGTGDHLMGVEQLGEAIVVELGG